jgi:hypothetical protein
VNVDRPHEATTLEHGDAFRGCVATAARAANLVRIVRFPEFFQVLTRQATALHPYLDLCIAVAHA